MKKGVIGIVLICLILCDGLIASAETAARSASIGAHFGGASIFSSNYGYQYGAEFIYRFKEKMGVRAEFGYASSKSSFSSSGPYYTSWDKTKYTLIPIDFSFLYIIPVNKNFSAYFGLGGGYYSLSIRETSYQPNTSPQATGATYNLKAWAPHLCFGFETDISKRFGIFGEAKYFSAKDKLSKGTGSFTTEQDFIFGGPQLKIGIRFYLKSK